MREDENAISPISAPMRTLPATAAFVPSCSQTMHELENAVADIAHGEAPVLLVGEKGAGKETIARLIHDRGGLGSPFIKVTCSEFDAQFFRELFERTGRAELEKTGPAMTVFLDEIGDLSLSSQSALAATLVDGNGHDHPHRFGARLISSSSRNLEEDIRRERFREDLFYRLNGICLRVPPLRHRKDDIPALMEFFLKQQAQTIGCSPAVLQAQTMQALLRHSWPGNVRELQEFAKRVLLSDERTALAELSADTGSPATERFSAVLSLKEAARNASRQVERELILKTLARTRWNRKRAARELGISYKALLYKLKQIVFDDPTGL